MQIIYQGTHQLVPGVEPVGDVQAVDLTLDIEDGVDLLHGLERDGGYVVCGLLLARLFLDVGKLEELPPGVAPTEGAEHRARITATAIEVVLAAVGIGLQYALPPGEIPVRMGHFPVTREVEQRGWRRRATKGPVISDIGPEPRCLRPSLRQEAGCGVVALQALGCQNMGPDQGMEWLECGGTGPDLIGQRQEKLRSTPSLA